MPLIIPFSWKAWCHLEYAQFNQNCKGFFKNLDNKFNFDPNGKRMYHQQRHWRIANSCGRDERERVQRLLRIQLDPHAARTSPAPSHRTGPQPVPA